MRILIDIGHPAHVHYFKNFISIMKDKGHEFLITARDKEITFDLLNYYKIPFVNRGRGGENFLEKMKYILVADRLIFRHAKKFKPDIFLSFASTYAAHVSKLYGKPHIAIDDTEHAKLELFLYTPFTDVILTPMCFMKDLGKKQIRFNSYVEFTYLHHNFFKPDKNIRNKLKIEAVQKFVLFRFVSWSASHDIGQKGIPYSLRKELISLFLQSGFKVFISSEAPLDDFFETYRLMIEPAQIHSVIYEASFLIGESGTMSTEACILGTPAIFVNSLDAGVFQDEVKHELLYSFRNTFGLVQKIMELLQIKDLKEKHKEKALGLHNDKLNITNLLVWFIENYPTSKGILKNNLDYQYNFK